MEIRGLMELIGIIVGIFVAVGLGAYLRSRRTGQPIGPLQVASIAAAAAIGAAIVGFGWAYLRPHLQGPSAAEQAAAVDRALRTIQETPLLGLVAAENPAIEARFRKALEEQVKDPQGGTQKLFELGAEIRRQFIVPVLKNADDAAALNASRSVQELAVHLQKTDLPICQQFGATGIQRPERLDSESLALFKRALAAQENAYRNGKAQTVARPTVSDQDLARVLTEAGYTPADFDTLAHFNKLSPAEACDATVKLYAAPFLLPPDRGAVLARYLLTVQQ